MYSINLKKIMNILSYLILLMVMVLSGMGMITATDDWVDTIYTCVWCLSIVMMSDRVYKFDTHDNGE
jgi:hypothetical protein